MTSMEKFGILIIIACLSGLVGYLLAPKPLMAGSTGIGIPQNHNYSVHMLYLHAFPYEFSIGVNHAARLLIFHFNDFIRWRNNLSYTVSLSKDLESEVSFTFTPDYRDIYCLVFVRKSEEMVSGAMLIIPGREGIEMDFVYDSLKVTLFGFIILIVGHIKRRWKR